MINEHSSSLNESGAGAESADRTDSEFAHEATKHSIDRGDSETKFSLAASGLVPKTIGIEGSLAAFDNRSVPAGSQLQVAGSYEYAQGIIAKIRSVRESIIKGGGVSTFTLAVLAMVVLILFVLVIVHYNRPHSPLPADAGLLLGASSAANDSRASLKATGAKSTPLQQAQRLERSRTVPSKRVTSNIHDELCALCPGLIVPKDNECILAVPIISHSRDTEMETTHVKDMQGKFIIQADLLPTARALRYRRNERPPLAILRAGITHPPPQSPPLQSRMHIAAPSLSALATCEWTIRYPSVSISDANDREFAHVYKEPPNKYILESDVAGFRYCFEGDFKNHHLTASELTPHSNPRLLADANPHIMHFDPNNFYFKLRINAGVDVGLILLAIYAIDCMEFNSSS